MFGKRFQLNATTLPIVEELGRHMPGGFFIYQAGEGERVLYINRAALSIFGCADEAEFRDLTGGSFRGMVHPEDYAQIDAAIAEQVERDADKMDFVEYRIVRRDGAVRWVEDYGHYTETDEYGGIYYVFLSDITEKRERLESDLATRQAVIEALIETYHTVWIITDVEAESFSLYRGDLKGDTVHAAPIREALKRMKYSQAKDYYIRSTVAEVDQARLQIELGLDVITARIREKPVYHVTYRRKMGDGSTRYFEIEFAKIDMPGGRLGVVCGFRDVDDEVRAEKAYQKALRDAKLAEEENRRLQEQADNLARIAALTRSVTALMSNMPALTSSKDAETGRYLACNQLFAAYAHRTSPEEVVGLSDYGIFDEITARHFAAADRKALETDEPYVYYEDVLDPAGEPRQFQTTKLKFYDAFGKKCVLTMSVDVTEMMRIRRETDEAKLASAAKTTFLFNMSHDLRTPLNSITGFTAMAKKAPGVPAECMGYLDKIEMASRQLVTLLTQVLEMSRLESGKLTLDDAPVDLNEQYKELAGLLAPQAEGKGLSFRHELRNLRHAHVIADAGKIKQILLNIVGNAVKFTPAGGSVDILFEELNDAEPGMARYCLTVRDTGIGMTQEFLKAVFEPFSRARTSTDSQLQGVGLGLSIVKRLVELLGGEIEIHSMSDRGTEVRITGAFRIDETAEEREEEGWTPELFAGRRVLVVDDIEMNREIASFLLLEQGMEPDEVCDGAEAVERMRDCVERGDYGYYDLILMDIQMPRMNGYEATEAIRALPWPEGVRLPILALTANAFQEDVAKALATGMDGHIAKPIDVPQMLTTIAKALKAH